MVQALSGAAYPLPQAQHLTPRFQGGCRILITKAATDRSQGPRCLSLTLILIGSHIPIARTPLHKPTHAPDSTLTLTPNPGLDAPTPNSKPKSSPGRTYP